MASLSVSHWSTRTSHPCPMETGPPRFNSCTITRNSSAPVVYRINRLPHPFFLATFKSDHIIVHHRGSYPQNVHITIPKANYHPRRIVCWSIIGALYPKTCSPQPAGKEYIPSYPNQCFFTSAVPTGMPSRAYLG